MAVYGSLFRIWVFVACVALPVGCTNDTGDNNGSSNGGADVSDDSDSLDADSGSNGQGDVFCTAHKPCCDESGGIIETVCASDFCSSGSNDQCSDESQCYDSVNEPPTCVGAEGEIVQPECEFFGERTRWECPDSTTQAGDAGMDAG